MPWTIDDPPPLAKNWPEADKKKCTKAANAVLADGGSEQDAIFACIHAAGRGEKAMDENTTTTDEVVEKEETEEKMYGEEMPYGYGATSFADLDALEEAEEQVYQMRSLASKMAVLTENIFMDSTIEDKAAALQKLANEFAQRVSEPPEEKERGLFDRIVDAVKNAVTPDEPEPATTGLMIWKEADGVYKWIARYSNNFRDEDNPPEIIAAKSHQRFAEMVDQGEAPLPELWLWHVKEWRWGQAEWVAYDDAGFALAGGIVNKGFEPLAETIMTLDPDILRVSHGMPKNSIVRDEGDPSIIVEHVTREISPLPAWAAANDLTGFSILSKEVDMAIPEEKKVTLQEEWNVSPDLLGTLEAANAADAKEAEEAGIEHKEKDEGEAETPEETQEAPQELTRAELGEVVAAIGEAMTAITTQVNALAGEVKELKEHKAAEDEETLTDLFQRAIGHEQAQVDGRTRLAKKGPKETPSETAQPAVVATGNPLVDNMVNALVSGSWTDGFTETQGEVKQ